MLGEALKGERRESLEIFTKVFGPTGPKGHNDLGLSRKHIMEAVNGSLQRLQTDYIDLYQAHRYDYETPLEETMQAFADLVRQGKVLYIGVSEWTADQLRDGHALAKELGFQLISNQPQYSMLWRVIEARGRAGVTRARHLPGRLVADRAGRADRQVPPGQAAAGGLARHRRQGRREHDRALDARRRADPGAAAQAAGRGGRAVDGAARPSPGCCRTTTWPPRSSARPGRSRSTTTSRRRA